MPKEGEKLSEETRKKISESRLGKPSWNKGLHFSEESKQKMSEAKLGKKMSDEFRNKRSEIMKARWKDPEFKKDMSEKHSGENHYNFGGHLSEDQKSILRESRKRDWESKEYADNQKTKHTGKTASEETRDKMSVARKGMIFTEEHKQKIRESHLANENPKKHSDLMLRLWRDNEFKQKVCDARKKRVADNPELMRDLSTKRWNAVLENNLNNLWYGNIKYYNGPQYCEKWTAELRERVRAYFEYCCVECGTPQNGHALHIHHVWYNKRLCCDDTPRSLVPLCSSCHAKTNTNRDYWSEHFQAIIDTYYEGRCWFTKEEFAAFQPTP